MLPPLIPPALPASLHILFLLLATIHTAGGAATFTLTDLLAQQGSSVVGCITFPFVNPSQFASSAFPSIDFRLLLATPLSLQATVCLPLTVRQAAYFSSNCSSTVNPLGVTVYALPATFSSSWQSYIANSSLVNTTLPLLLLPSNTVDEWTLLAHSLASNGYVTLILPLSAACPLPTTDASGVPDSLLGGQVSCVSVLQQLLVFGVDSVQAEMQTPTSSLFASNSLTSLWHVVYVAAGGLCALLLGVVQQLALTSVRSTRVPVTHAGVYCLEPFSVPLSVGYPAFFSPPGSFSAAAIVPSTCTLLSLSSASSCLSPPAQYASPLYSLLLTQPSPPSCLTAIQSSAAATHPCLYSEAALRAQLGSGSVAAVAGCAREDECRAQMAAKTGASGWVGASSAGVMDAVGHRVLLWRLLSGWLSWIAAGGGAGSAWRGWRSMLQNSTADGVVDSLTQNCLVNGTEYNQ